MASREVHHLADFGFRNLVTEHTNDRHTLLVHDQHQFKGLRVGQAKEPLKHMDDELHRREVVVQQKHLVERRPFGTGLRLQHSAGVIATCLVCLVVLGQSMML